MLKIVGVVFATGWALLAVSQSEAATKAEVSGVDWNKQSVTELYKLVPDLQAAQQFAVEVMAAEPDVDQEDLTSNPPEVVDYEFADLKGDGSVQFVCLLDYTGRSRPTELMALENNLGHLITAYLQAGAGGLGIGPLREIIRSLRHDGKNEVLTGYALEPFESAVTPTPNLEHVYVYQDGSLSSQTVFFSTITGTRYYPSSKENSGT